MAKPAAAKRQLPPALARLGEILFGKAKPLTIAAIVLAAMVGAWYAAWREVRAHVLSKPDYVLTPDAVEITPQPRWIRSDVRAEVFGAAGLDRAMSIMDDALTERIAGAFALHPWVARVRKVSKQHPARVVVELEYRQPVMVVETAADALPVDGRGVLLPAGDLSPVEKARYPRLIGISTAPLGTRGEPWGDPRVVGAAAIATAFGPAWQELKLDRIAASPRPASTEPEDFLYAVLTRGGTQILWGRAPFTKRGDELPVGEKIVRLRDYVRRHGTLEGREGVQQLDVRSMN